MTGKQFTEAELMAEYWRSDRQAWRAFATKDPSVSEEDLDAEALTLLRMASRPHFFEVIPNVDLCGQRYAPPYPKPIATCTLHVGHVCADHLDEPLGVRWRVTSAATVLIPEDGKSAPLIRDYAGNYHHDYWKANP